MTKTRPFINNNNKVAEYNFRANSEIVPLTVIYDAEDEEVDDANDAEACFASADADDTVTSSEHAYDTTKKPEVSALTKKAITGAHAKANTRTCLDSVDESDGTVRDHDLPDDDDNGTTATAQASASAPRANTGVEVQANARARLNMADESVVWIIAACIVPASLVAHN
jgi:hypothetical protein